MTSVKVIQIISILTFSFSCLIILWHYGKYLIRLILQEKLFWNPKIENTKFRFLLFLLVANFFAFWKTIKIDHSFGYTFDQILFFIFSFTVITSSTFIYFVVKSSRSFPVSLRGKEKKVIGNIEQTEAAITDEEVITLNFLKKWFYTEHKENTEKYLLRLLRQELNHIPEKIYTNASKKTDVGRILFQLMKVDFFDESYIKKIYDRELIIQKKNRSFLVGDDLKGHKSTLKLYHNKDINIPKLLNRHPN